MAYKSRICVDFDGTIYDGVGIMPGCVDALTKLSKIYAIAVFSARATDPERNQMADILKRFGVPHDEILPPKPEADFYIDDKAFRFESWETISL